MEWESQRWREQQSLQGAGELGGFFFPNNNSVPYFLLLDLLPIHAHCNCQVCHVHVSSWILKCCEWRGCRMYADSDTACVHLLLICGQYRMYLTSAVLAESTLSSLRLRLHQLDTLRPLFSNCPSHSAHLVQSVTSKLNHHLTSTLPFLLFLLLLPLRLYVRKTRNLRFDLQVFRGGRE